MISELGKSLASTIQGLFNKPVTDSTIEASIKEICISLVKSNVNPKYIPVLRQQMKEKIDEKAVESNVNKAKLVQKVVFECLVKFLDPGVMPYEIVKGKPNVVVFVGLQGCGKTTSICKYANYYKKKGFKTGIVCADTFRAGAFDQVKQNAEKIGVPFFGSAEADPVKVAREGVAKFRKSDFELILVDTSGRHTQEEALFAEMKSLVYEVKPNNIIFVMDAGIGQSAEDQAIGFKNAVTVGGIILTKLDGAEKAGGALSSVAATHCPIEFIGNGEGMDDLEVFNPKRFVSKLLGMGDVEGLFEKISSINIDQADISEKMKTGTFKLIDFKNLYSQIMSLGPLSKMLEMIPGMQNLQIPDEQKFQKIMHIFDSLSKTELMSDGELFSRQPSRFDRVANGSGTSVDAVRELIVNFRHMNVMMKKLMNNPMFAQLLGGEMPQNNKDKLKKQMNGNLPSKLFDYMDSLE